MSVPIPNAMNHYKYKPTPKKCGRCKRMLKSPKRYVITRIVQHTHGFWTLVKACKGCKFENINGDKSYDSNS